MLITGNKNKVKITLHQSLPWLSRMLRNSETQSKFKIKMLESHPSHRVAVMSWNYFIILVFPAPFHHILDILFMLLEHKILWLRITMVLL